MIEMLAQLPLKEKALPTVQNRMEYLGLEGAMR